jgi:aryl-alcohol dehydrogenase-like predicted oxidoreductase
MTKAILSFFFLFMLNISAFSMEYVQMCKSPGDCKSFSRLVMGTDHLVQADWQGPGWPEINEQELRVILDEALKLGINFYDTSPIYVGGIEYKLGKWKQARPDHDIHILSKGGFPFDLYWAKSLEAGTHSLELVKGLKQSGVMNQEDELSATNATKLNSVPAGTYASRLFGSLKQIEQRVQGELHHTINNLNGDITVYLMHRDDGDYLKFAPVPRKLTPVKRIMTALTTPAIADKFWGLGWSNWKTDRVNTSVKLAQTTNLNPPLMNSPYFSLFEMSSRSIHAGGIQTTHAEMMNQDFQKGIKIMPYSPLGGFSIFDKPAPRWENAKWDAFNKFAAGDPYWMNVYNAIFTDANEGRFKRLEQFTKEFNHKNNAEWTIDQMANAYVLAHKRTDFLAIGPITIEQLRRTVKSLELAQELTLADLEYLHSGQL